MNTKKKLLAYQISGQTVGVDLPVWNTPDLNGNQAFLIITSADTTPSGYTDITSIQYWDEFGMNIANDYLVVKFEIRDILNLKGWTGLTNTEKDIAIKYYATQDAMAMIIHLMMTKGYSQAQAQAYVLKAWHIHHGNVVETCKQRWFYVKIIVAAFLSFSDAEDLFDTCSNLVYEYTELGRLGKDYGDNNDGIMDYLMSTNGFAGQGLEENNYDLVQGTWAIFKDELSKVLVCGIYNKYLNEELNNF
jgi:hypothetical protein